MGNAGQDRKPPELAPDDAPIVLAEELTAYSYPAKLIQCDKVLSDKPIGRDSLRAYQLYQVFERPDRKWASDGNLVCSINRLVMAWGNKDPVTAGSDYDVVATAAKEVCGNTLTPDGGGKQFINHWFMVSDVESKSSVAKRQKDPDARPFYLRIITKHLGEDYEYTGAITTVGSGSGQDAAPAVATSAVSSEDNADNANKLAFLLAGKTEDEIRTGAGIDLVNGNADMDAAVIYDLTVKGGLFGGTRAPLLDKLIEHGHVTIGDDGILVATGAGS